MFTRSGDSAGETLPVTQNGKCMEIGPSTPARAAAPPLPEPTDPLFLRARELEAVFLAEMLSMAGLGEASDTFGGGIGEDQFASFLRQEQATAIVAKGGIGLAEALFRAMGGENGEA